MKDILIHKRDGENLESEVTSQSLGPGGDVTAGPPGAFWGAQGTGHPASEGGQDRGPEEERESILVSLIPKGSW